MDVRLTVTWEGPGVEAWQPWTPRDVAARLDGLAVTWCVVGGWAVDLFLGEETRPHEDLEIATQRAHLSTIRRRLAGFVFHAVGDGSVQRLGPDEQGPADCHQHWVLDERAGEWRVDVMVEPGDEEWWVYRRDESIRMPRAEMVATTADGVPYLLPHGLLLYKAKNDRDKDWADFAQVAPRMDAASRAWLATAIDQQHPGHPWVRLLTAG